MLLESWPFPTLPWNDRQKMKEQPKRPMEYWNRLAERASQPITPLKPLQTGRLLALIAGSHEAAGAASAGRQSVTGLMVHTTVGGWSQMSLSSDCQIHATAVQGERRKGDD